ncbi:MAG: type II secretion system minor pseudopilin GspK [Polaromonas sp.]|nr:type II secretion system minor pseudopilin GspK [Polaromonas sp.]
MRATCGDVTCHRGAALLSAMLTVTLVATFAAAALWQQFRGIEIETAERGRVQASWILTGSLDWARLILREDGRNAQVDHLGEPWAVPLNEARLSSFLAVDASSSASESNPELEAFLSGQITDLQSRMNVTNLIDGNALSETSMITFGRLFESLGLQASQLSDLSSQLLEAARSANPVPVPSTTAGVPNPPAPLPSPTAPLMPQRVEQLIWLGLDPAALAVLRPYITLLPARTAINLNTASAEVIHAATPGMEMADAKKLVTARASSHFRTVADAIRQISSPEVQMGMAQHAVASRYFEVQGRLRIDKTVVEERSLLQRDGLSVRTLWRDRGVVVETAAIAVRP